jgi:hypothetical protein
LVAAPLTGGRTTKGGIFGYTKHDANQADLSKRGEAGQARDRSPATHPRNGNKQGGIRIGGLMSQRWISRRPGCFRFAEA